MYMCVCILNETLWRYLILMTIYLMSFVSLIFQYHRINSSRCSRNYEAIASEFQNNLEEMFSRYYINGKLCSKFKSSTTSSCVTYPEKLN